jgi:hypothetical protein
MGIHAANPYTEAMASLTAVREALATALSGITGLRVSPIYLGTVNPPAAIIMPQPRQALRFDALGGSVSYLLRIILLGSYTEDSSSQALMDGYLASTGSTSIAAALAANPTLSGACDYCNMDTVNGYGLMEWSAQQYLGTQILVTVAASTP